MAEDLDLMMALLTYQMEAKIRLDQVLGVWSGGKVRDVEWARLVSAFLAGVCYALASTSDRELAYELLMHLERLRGCRGYDDVIKACQVIFEKTGYVDLI